MVFLCARGLLIYREDGKGHFVLRDSYFVFRESCWEKREGVWEKMSVEEGQVLGVHTVEAWNEHLQKGNESNKLVCCLYR